MSHSARIGYRLRPAAFVLRAGDAILRPDFHGHADYLVALLTQQISGHAGVHPTAHAKQNAFLLRYHFETCNFNELGCQSTKRLQFHWCANEWTSEQCK